MVTHKRTRGDKIVAEWQSSQTGFFRWQNDGFAPVMGPDRYCLIVHGPPDHPGLGPIVKRLATLWPDALPGEVDARAPSASRESREPRLPGL
jgi:hypothetical protein